MVDRAVCATHTASVGTTMNELKSERKVRCHTRVCGFLGGEKIERGLR
jgi:hypothetical protein